MIISRTPFRVSFFGGGTDYPAWYREHGGSVLATSIDKYCYITCRYLPPFFEHKTRLAYSQVELVARNSDLKHPAARAILQHLKIEDGVEIHHDGDLPARTGLGSSSAFAVGLLHALYALKNRMSTKMQLAQEAIHIEQEVLKENVGCQDQMIAAIGGLQRVDFLPNDDIRSTPIIIDRRRVDELQSHCLLYFTGFTRFASEIVKEQLQRMPDKKAELTRMQEMVDESLTLLTGKDADMVRFGRLLDESWKLKRTLSAKVSTPQIDEIYDLAKASGALGGKLLGAGGGGFMLLFVRPQDQPKVREKLKALLRIPFRFESEGSQVILYQPETVSNES